MALEPFARTGSPASSGRASPAPRMMRRGIDDGLLKKDKSYRRYAAGIERVLADSPQQEWADYISFLGRLLKAIQAGPEDVPVIPQSNLVATRLAQCLNPVLPAGVHQKALEVYSSIFRILGRDALSRDLSIFLPGLSTVLSFASLTVRPLFLSLYETYILKLEPQALRPALKSVILSLLPGLEDDTSEDFERLLQALDRLSKAVEEQEGDVASSEQGGASHFWQSLFLATITNEPRRQGALAYLARRLPKFRASSEDKAAASATTNGANLSAEALAAISPEPGLLVRCFAAGLSDSQILIQRGFLDLLVSHLPLNSLVLQEKVSSDDLDRLVASAAGVVARRDMSLNRRLWTWFLGPGPNSSGDDPGDTADGAETTDSSARFFSRYGLAPLTRTLKSMIKTESTSAADHARPFRICLSLMDRWEVGGLVVPEIFVTSLQSVEKFSRSASANEVEEVLRSASLFFDGVESGLIWGKLLELMSSALRPGSASGDEQVAKLHLVRFVLSRFNVREEEMIMYHAPLLLVAALAMLSEYDAQGRDSRFYNTSIVAKALEIVDFLTQLIPARALRDEKEAARKHQSSTPDTKDLLNRITGFYGRSQGNLEISDSPLVASEFAHHSISLAGAAFFSAIEQTGPSDSIEITARTLSVLVEKASTLDAVDKDKYLSATSNVLASDPFSSVETQPSFACLSALTTVLVAAQSAVPDSALFSASESPALINDLVHGLWGYLASSKPKYHVEAVRCLWQLHSVSVDTRRVEASITSLVSQQNDQGYHRMDPEATRRFCVLWSHSMAESSSSYGRRSSKPASRRVSAFGGPVNGLIHDVQAVLTRPLLHVLETLSDESGDASAVTRSWLRDPTVLQKVLDILIAHVMRLQLVQVATNASASLDIPAATATKRKVGTGIDRDVKRSLYTFKLLLALLRSANENIIWNALSRNTPTTVDDSEAASSGFRIQESLAQVAMCVLAEKPGKLPHTENIALEDLQRTCVDILQFFLTGPDPAPLRDLATEVQLIALLPASRPAMQARLLRLIVHALKLHHLYVPGGEPQQVQQPLDQAVKRSSISKDMPLDQQGRTTIKPPAQLIACLKTGFTTPASRPVLDDWVEFLGEVLPLFESTMFQHLPGLVDTFCLQIEEIFEQLRLTYKNPDSGAHTSPESTLISLMNGLEQILAKAHETLVSEEQSAAPVKAPEQPQGLFGNVMGNMFASDTAQPQRSATANSRLTILLCFKDVVKMCFSLWSWHGYSSTESKQDPTSAASFGYASLRLRNRARRILENLFATEPLECLETLVVMWDASNEAKTRAAAVLGLLNVLERTKPKHTIPAIFNAIYTRTNPKALEPTARSTKISDITDVDLICFLVDYIDSLEDDAMDEIWPDCMSFLKDLISNPMDHRQILPMLLQFVSKLAQKVDNTNFGEQRRMRRELGDLFLRLLTATFITKPAGYAQGQPTVVAEKTRQSESPSASRSARATDIVAILSDVVPHFSTILVENDRITNAVTAISANIVAPTIRAKAYPTNIHPSFISLLHRLGRIPQSTKLWRKDIADAFNDPRFLAHPAPLLHTGWLPILRQWTLADKDRVPELLSRFSAPTSAGIMFGVGATSARNEADRRTQLNLCRIALLVLANPEDALVPFLSVLQEKLVELLSATPTSSPSSVTRAEVYILLRALILRTSAVPLAPLWPMILAELTTALCAVLPGDDNTEKYNNVSVLQACKLLDLLVALDPEDFQLHEWLYITDTIDAAYRSPGVEATALADSVAEQLSSITPQTGTLVISLDSTKPTPGRPMLSSILSSLTSLRSNSDVDSVFPIDNEGNILWAKVERRELVTRVLKPWFEGLSLWAFEERYAMRGVDVEECVRDVVGDLAVLGAGGV